MDGPDREESVLDRYAAAPIAHKIEMNPAGINDAFERFVCAMETLPDEGQKKQLRLRNRFAEWKQRQLPADDDDETWALMRAHEQVKLGTINALAVFFDREFQMWVRNLVSPARVLQAAQAAFIASRLSWLRPHLRADDVDDYSDDEMDHYETISLLTPFTDVAC